MKRLTVFSIRSFIGPFIVTFAIAMFILIMQFFWKYIDDLMGKGIETIYILELLFYVSASLIPLALPLAMLLSSIMTLGNLAEFNELTALKSSGLSLYRILRPLTVIVLILAFSTFLFANYVIPVANYKWRSLIYDFQNTKIASIIVPGVYTKEIDGYAIKANKKNADGSMEGITIHDKTKPNELKIVKAKKGTLYKSDNGKYLFFNLKNGIIVEELATYPPTFDGQGNRNPDTFEKRETRRSTFDEATYKVDLIGFTMDRGDDESFKDDYEMLTVFQIHDALDSMKRKIGSTMNGFVASTENSHEYFQATNYRKLADSLRQEEADTASTRLIVDEMTASEKRMVYEAAILKIDNRINSMSVQFQYLDALNRNSNRYWVEFHRKFALTYAIVVLFFVGAPLGAIVRKGGFGAPVVIAALLFMLYFILITIGESLVESDALTPFWGMWFSSVVLTPIAIFLMYAAANDLPIASKETWAKLFRIRSFKRKKTQA
ncbi:MAG: LptF/LptG family permease [Crocinitomicaceae bacterium]|nr:LptF/LptG family permease [Crocinitomicaceae bacterium]